MLFTVSPSFLQGIGYRVDLLNLVEVILSSSGRWIMTVEPMNFESYFSDAPSFGSKLELLINFLFWATF